MATTPFTAGFEASLKQPIQGGKTELLTGHVVWPQFFCCVSGTNVGVEKAPVALIKADDTYVCTEAPVCVDILGSWSPTSTLVTWAVNWDDGNNSNGAWPPGGDICHPLGGYAITDTYDVTLTVTDLLGVTDSDIVQITAVDCPPDPLPPFCMMVGGYGAGPFYTHGLAGGATVWHGLDLGSLAAAGAKNCHVLKEYHWLDGHVSVFMGTHCGIYEYVVPATGSPYGGTWQQVITPADLMTPVGLTGAPYVWDLHMVMDREGHEGWGYCAFKVYLNPGAQWECAASTRDGWQTIHAAGIVHVGGYSWIPNMCAIAQHTPTTVYANGHDGLYRSVNSAQTFTYVDANPGADEKVVYVPWNSPDWDDNIIYHAANGGARRSVDGGAIFASIGNLGRPQHMFGPTFNANWIWMSDLAADGRARYWDPVGGVQTFGSALGIGRDNRGGGPLTTDASYFPVTWLLVGHGSAGVGIIMLNTAVGRTDQTGDWNAKTGNNLPACMLHRTPEPWDPGGL